MKKNMAMFSKLKQFKDLRDKAKKAQDLFKDINAEGSAVFGKIKIDMDGNFKIGRVEIDESLFSPENKSKVEGGVKDAMADAIKKVQKSMAEAMRKGNVDLSDLS